MGNNIKALSNFMWRFAERCGAQLVQFVVSLVLARLLGKNIYGTVSLILVFTTILNVFVDSGLGNALIQKKDADDLDFSSVFYFNMLMCTSLYALMFLCAPAISAFYESPDLTPVIRVLSLTLIVSGLKNVQQAYVARTLQFKRFFFATLGGTIGAAIVGIFMAVKGFGVWALVAQQLFNLTVDTLVLWITVKWRPRKMFSLSRLKALFSYGWKLLISALLDTGYNNLRSLLIGKLYTAGDIAIFNKGRQFPYLIVNNVNTSIDSVLLPVMSREQENAERVKSMTKRAIRTSTFIMAPLMVGLFVVARPLVIMLLTEEWAECIPYLRIFCLVFLTYPIHTANLNAMKAMGRSDLFLRLEIIKKAVGLVIIFATIWISPIVMAYGMLLECACGILINTWPNRKLLNYSFIEQMRDIFPAIFLSAGMGLIISPILLLPVNNFCQICLMTLAGGSIYVAGAFLFKLEAFLFLLEIAGPILRRLKKK